MDINQIAENIKKFRELKSMPREIMAARLNMSLSGYSKVERGEVDLTISRLLQISEVLEVDLSQVLNFDVSHIFNISNNTGVNGTVGQSVNQSVYCDGYKEKYITKLEEEVARLKNELSSKMAGS